jgi:hypothetical protein
MGVEMRMEGSRFIVPRWASKFSGKTAGSAVSGAVETGATGKSWGRDTRRRRRAGRKREPLLHGV